MLKMVLVKLQVTIGEGVNIDERLFPIYTDRHIEDKFQIGWLHYFEGWNLHGLLLYFQKIRLILKRKEIGGSGKLGNT